MNDQEAHDIAARWRIAREEQERMRAVDAARNAARNEDLLRGLGIQWPPAPGVGKRAEGIRIYNILAKHYDVPDTKRISAESTIPEMETLYRLLSLAAHPDKGGSVMIMKLINNIKDELIPEAPWAPEGGRRRTAKVSTRRSHTRKSKAKRRKTRRNYL